MAATETTSTHFDVIVLGCGPAGERAAIQAAKAGKRVAVIERAHVVGGARINWGTIPSKTLRESALFVDSLTRNKLHGIRCEIAGEITVADFMYRERVVVQRELELVNDALDRYNVEVLRGHGRFTGPHSVAVDPFDGGVPAAITGDVIVIATGSSPNRPPDVPFDASHVLDSDTVLQVPRLPRSLIVLGAGVVGIEYASIFAALGLKVTMVDTRDRLLPFLDREIVAVLKKLLQRRGIDVFHDDRHAMIEVEAGNPPRVRCLTKRGLQLEAEALLYCVGRDGNTADLGLDTIDLVPNHYGLLAVNENFQTSHGHIYAVGDVIGYPALASTSMAQGRQAIRHAFALPGPPPSTELLPFAIYSIPEVSYIGDTEEALRLGRIPYVAGRGSYEMNPRGQILGDTDGLLKVLFEADGGRLRGVHIVGHSASELIHIGQAWLRSGATAAQIAETLFNYPTLSDLYRHAANSAVAELRRLGR